MSQFKRAVQELVRQEMKGTTHSVMGYIPKGTIPDSWTTTVRIPHPHGGIHPTADESQRYLEFKNVPMPYNATGVLVAIKDMFYQIDRQVTVGFRGGSLTEPYIIDYQSPLHEAEDKPSESLPNRNGVASDRATGAGGCQTTGTSSPVAQGNAPAPGTPTTHQVLANRGGIWSIGQNLAMAGPGLEAPPPGGVLTTVLQNQAELATRLQGDLNPLLGPERGFGFTVLVPPPAAPAAQETPRK